MNNIHYLYGLTSGEVYDDTQCLDEITDGDVIVTDDAVVVLVEAWPVAVYGTPGELHTLTPDADLATMDDGKYAEAARIARAEAGLRGLHIG